MYSFHSPGPAAYGVIAYIVGGVFVWVLNRQKVLPAAAA